MSIVNNIYNKIHLKNIDFIDLTSKCFKHFESIFSESIFYYFLKIIKILQ